MIFRGPFINTVTDQDFTDNYIPMYQELRDAGFTHVGLQMYNVPDSPTEELWIAINTHAQAIRTASKMPLAFGAVPYSDTYDM